MSNVITRLEWNTLKKTGFDTLETRRAKALRDAFANPRVKAVKIQGLQDGYVDVQVHTEGYWIHRRVAA